MRAKLDDGTGRLYDFGRYDIMDLMKLIKKSRKEGSREEKPEQVEETEGTLAVSKEEEEYLIHQEEKLMKEKKRKKAMKKNNRVKQKKFGMRMTERNTVKKEKSNVLLQEEKGVRKNKKEISKMNKQQQIKKTKDKYPSKTTEHLSEEKNEYGELRYEEQGKDKLKKKSIKEEISQEVAEMIAVNIREIRQEVAEKVAVNIKESESMSFQSDEELEEGELNDDDDDEEGLNQEQDDEEPISNSSNSSDNLYREMHVGSRDATKYKRTNMGEVSDRKWVDFPDGAKILVQCIPPEANVKTLRKYFCSFGHILFVYRKHNGNKGFIIFDRKKAADKVLREDHQILGIPVIVSRAPPLNSSKTPTAQKLQQSFHIFVSPINTSDDVSKLTKVMSKYGRLSSILHPPNKTFALVKFAEESSATPALSAGFVYLDPKTKVFLKPANKPK
ncbi:hypothetical protein Pcinc_032653 [Petrolisthes cinctipes]|uniref:RRM domain-containing protein n=1 Tax=Petrolisthes cinctipes TaxID=88211 RepID=A0AAE1ETW8_PETCI|nr:hypothetical protein Pcinc_032653 [Petrolisthes cinctipes]